jgi:flagellar motor switch protein FliM
MPIDVAPIEAPVGLNPPRMPPGQELAPPAPAAVAGEDVRPFVFRQPALLGAGQLRKLRQRHEDFVRALSTRLAIYLRMECAFQVASLDTRQPGEFLNALPNPSQFAQFKTEAGTEPGLLEISPPLGLAFVDRLCGGAGAPIELPRGLSDLEVALLDRILVIVIQEWNSAVLGQSQAQPQMLGHETSARFLPAPAGDDPLLVTVLEARLGACSGKLHLALPFGLVEAIFLPAASAQSPGPNTPARPAAPPQWNSQFDTVKIPVTASWEGIEITVRQLASLQAGDVLPIDPALAGQTAISLARRPKFTGRLGRHAGAWAVELTQPFAP